MEASTMQVIRWTFAAVAVGAMAVVMWPRASQEPPVAEVTASPPPTSVSGRRFLSHGQERVRVGEQPSSERARTLEAEDALKQRSEVARLALIKRQRTRLQRAVAAAEDNPARESVLRERLSDLDRLAQEPLE